MLRIVFRIILFGAFAVSIFVILAAVMFVGVQQKETWAIIAAALAVITSIISAWSAQKILELQEDESKPNPLPSLDLTNRYGLVQFRVTNYGGGTAQEIRLRWNKPLLNKDGQPVQFHDDSNLPDIPALLPHESIATRVDGSKQFFEKHKNSEFTGVLEFKDASGKKTNRPFHLSAYQYRYTLEYENEELKTNYELQKIPEKLEKLTNEVRDLRNNLNRHDNLPPPTFR